MSAKTATIDPVKRLLRFPFDAADWRTPFLIGTGLIWAGYVIPLVPLIFVYGYAVRIMRQTIAGEHPSLPAWDDWGAIGRDGLLAAVVALLYMLPAFILFLGGIFLYTFTFLGLPLTTTLAEDPGAAAGLSILGIFLGMGAMFLALFIGFVLALAGTIPLPAAVAHVVTENDLGAAFRLRHIWRIIRADGWSYFTAWVIGGGLVMVGYTAFIAGYYTIVLICLMPFLLAPFIFYATIVGAAVFGESYRENVALLQPAIGEE